jgi:hypothetical protein
MRREYKNSLEFTTFQSIEGTAGGSCLRRSDAVASRKSSWLAVNGPNQNRPLSRRPTLRCNVPRLGLPRCFASETVARMLPVCCAGVIVPFRAALTTALVSSRGDRSEQAEVPVRVLARQELHEGKKLSNLSQNGSASSSLMLTAGGDRLRHYSMEGKP